MVSLKFNKGKIILAIGLLMILGVFIVNAQVGDYQIVGSPSLNVQYYKPSSFGAAYTSPSVYWPGFDRDVCRERQDFIVQIAPGGCQPAVVRSDLLEEQNVPVFCKLMLIQTNPLIDVSRVKSIKFPGKRPEGVAGITYFPSRYTLMGQRRDLADTPVDDNMGYFVVSLKKQPSEEDMPDWVGGDLTAVIDYDIENALGIGRTNFYVSELSEEEWLRDYEEYSFWNGKGYIKTESIEPDRVTVSVYRDFNTKEGTVTLRKGETSPPIYLGGFYCAAGLEVKLEDIQAPVESALLQIDDQQIWVARNDRILDGKCRVRDVDVESVGGKVSISCSVSNGSFDLRLNPGKITLEIGKNEKEYNIGDKLGQGDIFLGYVGKKGEKFAVLINDPYSNDEAEFSDKEVYSVIHSVVGNRKYLAETEISEVMEAEIEQRINDQYKRKLRKTSLEGFKVLIIKEGDSEKFEGEEITFVKATLMENPDLEDLSEEEELAREYYDRAVEDYRNLVDFYPHEKRIDDDYFDEYAAEGLYRAAELAQQFKMFKDSEEFLSQLQREYPDSAWARKAGSLERLLEYDSSEAGAVVYLRDRTYFVNLLALKKPTREELSVDLLIDGESENLKLDEVWSLENKPSIQVLEIDDNDVRLRFTKASSGTERASSDTATLDLDRNKQTVFEDVNVKLVKINLKKQARLSLDSEVRGPRAYANFSFKIGIEKRGIKLSPEKTQEMMENLKESIKKWDDVNEKLGKVVKGLKGACFATSAILMAKNMFTGFGGESLARNELMTLSGGWNNYCEKIVSSGERSEVNNEIYSSVQACLLGHNSDIEKDVKIYANYIEDTNKKLEQAREGLTKTTNILDFEGQVTDREAMERKFGSLIDCGNLNIEGFTGDSCGNLSFDDQKTLYTLNNALSGEGSQVMQDALQREKEIVELDARNNYEWSKERDAARSKVRDLGMKLTYLEGDSTVLADIHKTGVGDGFSKGQGGEVESGTNVVAIFVRSGYKGNVGKEGEYDIGNLGGQPVLVEVENKNDGTYAYTSESGVYNKDGESLSGKQERAVREYLVDKRATRFKESNAKAYENAMKNPDKLQVKYFDRAPYKGLPAEVPFDVKDGWYVKLEYVLSGFGKPYDESGRAINYYICNVGENGVIEFKRKADDICRYYNGINEDLGFPGLDASKSRQLVSRARNALYEASKYYGKEEAIISGRRFSTGTSFGGEAGRCSDFMSPSDCHIMFNLCDPVICPSSRCDLGGEFPVDNVIQTGIIGSLVLCLPNLKEKIYVPVCLSGVHAGIEGYLSILEAHRDCLNESLETGRNIGICDEIRSIYTCEFFWKQMVPFFDVIVPKLIESFFSQGVRGGGEYLTVQSAWDNTQSAIDYFKNNYAVNSMKAFQVRSTEEVGSEICKSFVSTRYPTDFDLLTEPDSPVQYHAWFDENVMTTATPYPTSHYKVYYHIYAGNDQGAYYIVYLKDIPEELASSYIYTSETYVVSRGYIARGEHVDEARDFTAPSGYKKLCVNINGRDECDFGKVSTSFAVDYLSDKYAEDQASQEITKSGDCVAGTPSLYSFAQPNLQAGAEEFFEPELYNQGIVRVCSTYNPGKQVDENGEYDTTNRTYDRWKDVGYCDDKKLRCWLDTSSVRDVIKSKELEKDVLKEVDTSVIGEKDYLTHKRSREIAEVADVFTDKLDVKGKSKGEIETTIKKTVEELGELAYLSPSNSHRARGFLLLGKLYGKIARQLMPKKEIKDTGDGGTPPAGTTPPTPEEKTVSGICELDEYIIVNEGAGKHKIAIKGTGNGCRNNEFMFEIIKGGLTWRTVQTEFEEQGGGIYIAEAEVIFEAGVYSIRGGCTHQDNCTPKYVQSSGILRVS